jgi:hypothetical protein
VSDEQQHWRFIALCPGKLPFLAGTNLVLTVCLCVQYNFRTQGPRRQRFPQFTHVKFAAQQATRMLSQR